MKRHELRELVERFMLDPQPLDATPELAYARALLADYERRCAEDPNKSPFDPHAAAQLVAEISKAVKRIHDAQAAEHISRPEFYRVLMELGRVVDVIAGELIADRELREELLTRIRKGWLSIRLA